MESNRLDDPRLRLLEHALRAGPARRLHRPAGCAEAAVALLLRPSETVDLLLIKRAELAADPWSGHIALPGGHRDSTDQDLLATAFRETTEETGIPLHRVGRLLGALDEVRPTTPGLPPIVISPFVVGVQTGTTAMPSSREVEAALWVPLPALRDPDAAAEIVLDLEDGPKAYPSLRYGSFVIWGLTHRILTQFLEVAESCGI